jgi:hypothetical protein
MFRTSSLRTLLVASLIAVGCCSAVARAETVHFQCYRAGSDALLDRTVTLTDQFGQIEARIETLERVCNPTDDGGNPGAQDRPERLVEYTLRRLSGYIPPQLATVTNQFGSFVLELRHHLPARALMVPAAVSSTSREPAALQPGAISNYTCYHIHPQPARYYDRVDLEDEMGAQGFITRSAEELCVPAKVDDQEILAGDGPLLCFIMRRRSLAVAPRSVFTTDALGSGVVDLQTTRWQHFCVPSKVVETVLLPF